MLTPPKKIGILGGGQLGKMLCLAAYNWETPIYILDAQPDFPAGPLATKFFKGDFNNYDDVYRFGQEVDILTIEIEHVNTAALKQLKKEGKIVHPDPEVLNVIKDKGLQKQFYQQHDLPTASFQLFENAEDILNAIEQKLIELPFVQKARTEGYDGRGVALIRSTDDLDKLLPVASVIEPMVPIKKEIAVVVAKNPSGEIAAFPPVEMTFHPTANLVEFLLCPADITKEQAQEVELLARSVIKTYDVCGLLAVEFFLTEKNEWLINEVAPRPHNSGHHTIDSCVTSQYQQHLRAILDLPLGNTESISPAVMINLLGNEGHTGPAKYIGIHECMAQEGSKFHLYGKTITKPLRKMGHATVLDSDLNKALEKATFIKDNLNIIT